MSTASGLVLPKAVIAGDHLLDRIDRRQMGDEEGQRDADEDDQDELGKALQHVDA